jgi:hypothetical protein
MILRRYGSTFQEVEPNFDARALTEIGFRRTHGKAVPPPPHLWPRCDGVGEPRLRVIPRRAS